MDEPFSQLYFSLAFPSNQYTFYQLHALLIYIPYNNTFLTEIVSLHALQESFPDTTPQNSLGYSLTRVNGETWGSLATAPLHFFLH